MSVIWIVWWMAFPSRSRWLRKFGCVKSRPSPNGTGTFWLTRSTWNQKLTNRLMIYKNTWAGQTNFSTMDWLPSSISQMCMTEGILNWTMNPSFPTVDVDCIPLYCHLGVLTTSSRAIVKAFPDLLSLNVPLRFPSISTSVLFKTEKAIIIYWNK